MPEKATTPACVAVAAGVWYNIGRKEVTSLKRILIYYPENGDEFSRGAVAELAESKNGNAFALLESPEVERIWDEFRKRRSVHSLSMSSADTLFADLMLAVEMQSGVPFRCYRKADGTAWMLTDRKAVSGEVAEAAMRGET